MKSTYQLRRALTFPNITNSQFFLWLIWPFASLVYAIRNFRDPRSKTLFWLFCIYFGFVFIYAEPFEKGTADSSRIAGKLIELHEKPISFESLYKSFYNDENFVDIYQPLTLWIVSRFTNDPKWLFTIFSLIFGFFYASNIWILLRFAWNRINWAIFLYILFFALINPIWNINGVRMWTSAQVFLYGLLNIFLLKNKNGWIWLILTVFIHFSFLFPLSLFLLYKFLPKNIHFYFAFFITTAFLNEINLAEVRNLFNFLPEIFQPRIQSYTNENYYEYLVEHSSKLSWHVILARNANNYLIYAWVILLYIYHKKWFQNLDFIKHLFIFTLYLSSWAHIASLVPSGGRFLTLSHSLFFSVIILLLIINSKKHLIHSFSNILTIPLIFVLIFRIRIGFDYMGISAFIGNPVIALFIEDQTPLIDFVKSLL